MRFFNVLACLTYPSQKTLKRAAAAAAAVMLCAAAGCAATKEQSASSVPAAPRVSSAATAVSVPSAVPAPASSSARSAVPSSVGETVSAPASSSAASSSSKSSTEPHFSFSFDASETPPSVAGIEIRSLSQALGAFDEIAYKEAEGTPEDIVKTLLERNVLCFAAMQGLGWTSDGYKDVVPIQSAYFRTADQMNDLFARTYTEDQAWRLVHPQEAGGYGEVFRDGEDEQEGMLLFDMNHLRRYHSESFSTTTYAAVISASDYEIEFGRYYTSSPTAGADEPNNMFFKAVRENGSWVLQNYITDADSWYQPAEFIKTERVGAPELMELAERQVGNIGGEKFWSWYGFDTHMEWCAAFTSWVYGQAGKSEPFFVGCYTGAEWFKEREQWGEADFKDIAPGDCIFFDWNDDDNADHVGLVAGTDGVYVYTVEGNRDDVCIQRAYALDFEYIMGYGLMDWSDIIS